MMCKMFTRIESLSLKAMLDLQRENQSLKERLKVAIAQMTDSVDTSDVEQRLNAADDEKSEIRQENDKYNETLQKWMAEFREEHDGHEPTEEDRFVTPCYLRII